MTTTQTERLMALHDTTVAAAIQVALANLGDRDNATRDVLLAALQAREGEAVAWSDDALNRTYSDGVAYGERNYRQAIATYQAEASGYKDAYFKLVESIANLKVFEPAPPIIIAAPQPAQDGRYILAGSVWFRKSTNEWVLELSGSINDTSFVSRHTQPAETLPENVPSLSTLYAAAPQPAQPESIECDCGRIHKKTRYGWACSEPAQPSEPAHPEQGDLTGCACRWDADDNRVATCVRHQGWLDVVHEWAERAKSAETTLQSAQPVALPLPENFDNCRAESMCRSWCGNSACLHTIWIGGKL